MKMKDSCSIVTKWPARLALGGYDVETGETAISKEMIDEFLYVFQASLLGSERYVEWKRDA
jgi:hypothetical protein